VQHGTPPAGALTVDDAGRAGPEEVLQDHPHARRDLHPLGAGARGGVAVAVAGGGGHARRRADHEAGQQAQGELEEHGAHAHGAQRGDAQRAHHQRLHKSLKWLQGEGRKGGHRQRHAGGVVRAGQRAGQAEGVAQEGARGAVKGLGGGHRWVGERAGRHGCAGYVGRVVYHGRVSRGAAKAAACGAHARGREAQLILSKRD
jgi:hypothetical protein